MWFKSLHLYRLHDVRVLSSTDLQASLVPCITRPLGSADGRRLGWTAPSGRLGSGQLLHTVDNGGHLLFSALRQERLLPSSVIAEEVAERVADIEAREARKVTRKEKTALKEQVTEEFMPRAFVRSTKIDLWWDTQRQLIGVNTGSRARAEEVLDLLRETLGTLKVTPLTTQTLPVRAMTNWLGDAAARPADMQMGDQFELKAKGDDGVIRGRQLDLDSDEIQQHLESGRQATQLALGIEGELSFVLHDDLTLKSLRFGDRLIEEADMTDDGDDALARFETDFALMTRNLRDSVARIVEWMGGEAQRGQAVASTKGDS
ncbi:recombination-associated protein RdgC [Vreelandella sp. EE22]